MDMTVCFGPGSAQLVYISNGRQHEINSDALPDLAEFLEGLDAQAEDMMTVAVGPDSCWVYAYDGGRQLQYSSNCPESLKAELNRVEASVICHVSIGSRGDWAVRRDTSLHWNLERSPAIERHISELQAERADIAYLILGKDDRHLVIFSSGEWRHRGFSPTDGSGYDLLEKFQSEGRKLKGAALSPFHGNILMLRSSETVYSIHSTYHEFMAKYSRGGKNDITDEQLKVLQGMMLGSLMTNSHSWNSETVQQPLINQGNETAAGVYAINAATAFGQIAQEINALQQDLPLEAQPSGSGMPQNYSPHPQHSQPPPQQPRTFHHAQQSQQRIPQTPQISSNLSPRRSLPPLPPRSPRPPTATYDSTQPDPPLLASLYNMGFRDRERNIGALTATGGDLIAAIGLLLEGPS